MLKTTFLTTLALIAFAGNSVLCRLALNDNIIDASSFTSIRLLSGAIFLLLLISISAHKSPKKSINMKGGSRLSAFFLFVYAGAFSYAYISLDTGTGALILFGAVQVTMIMSDIFKGKKLILIEWLGLAIAFIGLIILLMPSASAPSLTGFLLMAISGIAWAFYTLAGRGSKTPLVDTTNNFLRTLPFIALLMVLTLAKTHLSNQGILLAILSGTVTSGLGYAIWYSALSGLTVKNAAIIQLSVPIIAAIGGVIFANETINIELMTSSFLVLGGVFIVIMGKQCIVGFQRVGKWSMKRS
ncbi:DMT family transporter [Colwellia sp. MSW7]|uniref:DMT family transporter n=1 Tax=Colwellia maritima TaxID=2912588 RepID=A0ABS9X4B0_9GAMM|nr:DMT family transporter [Colwellia maritima]MCI2285078.1 DMT family transporter [Colwellia maritima]